MGDDTVLLMLVLFFVAIGFHAFYNTDFDIFKRDLPPKPPEDKENKEESNFFD